MNAFYEDRVNELKLWSRSTLNFLPHFHDSFEIVAMLSGNVDAIINGEIYSLSEGDISIVLPNTIHAYDNEKDINALLFIVPRRFADAFSKELESHTAANPVFHGGELFSLLHTIIDINKSSHQYKKQLLYGYFSILFAEIFTNTQLCECSKTAPETERRIISYCLENFRHDISLELLSKELNISKNHISYIFSSKLKTPLPDFLGALRVEEAKRLIEKGANMTDAALSSGFASIRTFNRRFLAETGLTPREYAKQKGAN